MRYTKKVQTASNHEIEYRLELFREYISNNKPLSTERLFHCKARVIHYDRFDALQSYNTLVAFCDKDDGFFYDVLRLVYGYTATSAQHIAKFYRLCQPRHKLVWRGVK